MRRFVGPVMFGLGAFFLIVAVMLKFYAYPTLAVAPADIDSTTELEATDAVLFDIDSLSEITTDLSVKSTTRGDVTAAEEEGNGVVVWAGTTTIRSSDGVVRSQSRSLAAHDEHTGEAVDCCGNFEETTEGEREAVVREGLVFKFPFDTQKETYDFWDGTIGDTVEMEYVEEAEVEGLDVYVFRGAVEPTVVGTQELPGSVVGSDEAAVEAEEVYSNERTMWVDPVTGAVVDRLEDQLTTFAIDGETVVTVTDAEITYTDEQVAKTVDDIDGQAKLLKPIGGLFPLLALLLGLCFLAGGLMARRRESASGGSHVDEDTDDRATTLI